MIVCRFYGRLSIQIVLGVVAFCSAQGIRLDLPRVPWPTGQHLSCADTVRYAVIPSPAIYSEAERLSFRGEFNTSGVRTDGIWPEWQARVIPVLHPRPFRLDLRTERDSCLDPDFGRGSASLILSSKSGKSLDSLVFGVPLEFNRMGWIRLGGLDTRRLLTLDSWIGGVKAHPKTAFEHIFPDSGKTPVVLRLVLRRHSVQTELTKTYWTDPVHGLSVNAKGLLYFDEERESNWMNKFRDLLPGDTAIFLRIDPAAPRLELIEKRVP